MSNQWFRMYHEFAHDPKIQMMGEAYQRRFVMIMCLKSCNGDVTLQDEEVAFQLRISNDEWLETKAEFIRRKLINDANEPAAWNKRQFISDSSKDRVAKHRAKKNKKLDECNGDVTLHKKNGNRKEKKCNALDTDTDTDTDTDIKNIVGDKPPIGNHVKTIFEFWKTHLDHPRAKLDKKREAKIRTALKTYSIEECLAAIRGCKKTPWNMGENDRGKVFDDIELILRDSKHIEEFITAETSPPKPPNGHNFDDVDYSYGVSADGKF